MALKFAKIKLPGINKPEIFSMEMKVLPEILEVLPEIFSMGAHKT